jgi:hypothetical protein
MKSDKVFQLGGEVGGGSKAFLNLKKKKSAKIKIKKLEEPSSNPPPKEVF